MRAPRREWSTFLLELVRLSRNTRIELAGRLEGKVGVICKHRESTWKHDGIMCPGKCVHIWRVEGWEGDWGRDRSQEISWVRLVSRRQILELGQRLERRGKRVCVAHSGRMMWRMEWIGEVRPKARRLEQSVRQEFG